MSCNLSFDSKDTTREPMSTSLNQSVTQTRNKELLKNQSFSEKPHGEAPPARVDEMLGRCRTTRKDAIATAHSRSMLPGYGRIGNHLPRKRVASHVPTSPTSEQTVGLSDREEEGGMNAVQKSHGFFSKVADTRWILQ